MKTPLHLFRFKADLPIAQAPKSRYEISCSIDTGEAEILMYGPVSSTAIFEGDIGADRVAKDLAELSESISKITVRLNSPGGDVFAGNAIYNCLKNHRASITIYIDGLAASAASVIAMAGDTVIMPRNAMIMIHDPNAGLVGNSSDLRTAAEALDKARDTMVVAYRAKTSMNPDEIKQIMSAETWLTADEAVDKKFADKIDEQTTVEAYVDGRNMVINGYCFDIQQFSNMPQAAIKSTPIQPGRPLEATMKIKELIAALRRFFGAEAYPEINRALDSVQAEIPEDAPAETVASRITTAFQSTIDAMVAIVSPLRAAGVTTADQVKAMLENAQLGKQYRTDLIASTINEGIRAQGDGFDKERWTRTLDACSLDDIKAYQADFVKQTQARLGNPGRQISPEDPNRQPIDARKKEDDEIQARAKTWGK